MSDEAPARPRSSTAARTGWALYDWANSPYTTLIITFVFSAYFSRGIVGDETRGTELWGYATSMAGLLVAVLAPILGAIADAGGRRKPWLVLFTALCASGSALLWFATPTPARAAWAAAWLVVATVGFEFGIVFVNAMLPDLVEPARLGRWSGWAWGLGYFGGLAALVVALVGFVDAGEPWLGLDRQAAEHVRIVGPLAGVWLVVFSIPLFLLTPDRPPATEPLGRRVSRGLRALGATLRQARRHGNVVRFLVARMIYTDGLATVFAFGGIYAAGTFDMELGEVIAFGILLNVTSGLGAIGFGWVDDWLGSKRTIQLAIIGLIVTGFGAVLADSKLEFRVWGALLGLFVGPAQAASRSLMARLAPAELVTEFFGLYALTGKATAFLGPLLVSVVTAATRSQRWGLATVFVFFVIGFALLWGVREAAAPSDDQAAGSSRIS
jgi:UMF1 family MFS transporter